MPRSRCPNGSRKNKKTGNCEKTMKKKKMNKIATLRKTNAPKKRVKMNSKSQSRSNIITLDDLKRINDKQVKEAKNVSLKRNVKTINARLKKEAKMVFDQIETENKYKENVILTDQDLINAFEETNLQTTLANDPNDDMKDINKIYIQMIQKMSGNKQQKIDKGMQFLEKLDWIV